MRACKSRGCAKVSDPTQDGCKFSLFQMAIVQHIHSIIGRGKSISLSHLTFTIPDHINYHITNHITMSVLIVRPAKIFIFLLSILGYLLLEPSFSNSSKFYFLFLFLLLLQRGLLGTLSYKVGRSAANIESRTKTVVTVLLILELNCYVVSCKL
jgi:hypothetical protein